MKDGQIWQPSGAGRSSNTFPHSLRRIGPAEANPGGKQHTRKMGRGCGWAKYQFISIAWSGCVSVRAKPMPNCWQGTGKGDNNAFGLGVTSAFARHKAPLPFHLSPYSSIFLVSCLLSQPVGLSSASGEHRLEMCQCIDSFPGWEVTTIQNGFGKRP